MNIFEILLLQPLANGLILFYNILFENLGLAIVFFSLFLRFILTPLTRPYMDSMKKMKDLAPELEKLKAKHKDDKMKLAQAQADFYKQKGVNPTAGCLPYLFQIVILIAFFSVFNRTLGSDNVTGSFNELLYPALRFPEDATLNLNFLYLDLSKPDVFNIGLPFPLPGPVLILAAGVQFLSAKIMAPYTKQVEKVAKKTPEQSDDMAAALQKSTLYTFPLLTLFIGLNFPSGLAIYWFLFSLYQTVQQYLSSGWGGLTPWISRLGLLQSSGDGRKK